MYHFVHHESYNVALLIKDTAFNADQIEEYYLKDSHLQVLSCSLSYNGKKKPSAADKMDDLNQILPMLDERGVHNIIVADGEYFKTMAKVQKAEPYYGSVLPCAIKGFEHINLTLSANYQAAMFNPIINDKIKLSMRTMEAHMDGKYKPIGLDIIHSEYYPDSYADIKAALDSLHQYPVLTADIETFTLKHYSAGIGTIAFAWDTHNGLAFSVDYNEEDEYELDVWCRKDKKYKTKHAVASEYFNEPVRLLLKEFFETYTGKIVWHNASFDCYILVYQLWMTDLLDQEGLLKGLEVMHSNMECTKLITYLATNSTAGNKLSLKDQAHEFAGNYAESEINNILLIKKDRLLRYNLIDTLATWYVLDKHYHTMVLDDQLEIYTKVFRPAVKDIIQMQLTGMCLDMSKVREAEAYMQGIYDTHAKAIQELPVIADLVMRMRLEKITKDNLTLKSKKRTMEDACIQAVTFNPNSGKQVQTLLYDVLDLPILDYTKSKQPATGKKTLKKLSKMTSNTEAKEVLEHLINIIDVSKILTAFIPTMLEAPKASDGMHYLFGNFNLGGTVSGRLSSSGPNLQNIPSGSSYAKHIKACFVAPKGWAMIGLDFNSLEDYISALTTKDPNKLAVYTKGYCGHCYRASYYFADKMPDIDREDPVSVNSIKIKYPELRQASKAPTFLLTYGGTYHGLVKNLGLSEAEAIAIERNYHELYKVSNEWVAAHKESASKKGYVHGAFNLRVRTPALAKTILGTNVTPYQAEAEGRTAGNALGQSWCLLNTRASIEFLEKVRSHDKYKHYIRPIAHIHDAQYFIVKDDLEMIAWINKHLVKACQWQEDPLIYHDTVKIGGELGIFYPNWSHEITIPNYADVDGIVSTIKKDIDNEKANK